MKRVAALAILVLAAVVAAWVWTSTRDGDSSELRLGGYVEAEQIQVGSKLGGRVLRIGTIERSDGPPVLVDEGAEVDADQQLVVFETDEVEAQLAEARAERERAAAKLAELKAGTRDEEIDQAVARTQRLEEKVQMLERGPRAQEIEAARLAFERSKAQHENHRTTFERVLALVERNAASRDSLDAARTVMDTSLRTMEADRERYELLQEGTRPEEIAMARHELAEAQAALALARKGPRAEEIEQGEAALEAASARIVRLQVLLDEGTVRAPLPAVVESFDLQPGDMVAAGAPLATLVRKDQLWVRAFVPETQLGLIADKQPVEVSVDSFPDERFSGTVLRVNRVGEFTPRNVQTFKERQSMMFGIKVRVHDPNRVLRPGMAATVHVPVATN